jgi:predicted ATPase
MEERECTPPGNKLALEACNRGPGTAEGKDKQEAMSPRQLLAEKKEKGGSKDDSQENPVLSASDSVVQDEPKSDAEAKVNNYAVDNTDNEILHSNESNMEGVNEDHESELNSALNWNVDNTEKARVAASEPVLNKQLLSREDDTTAVEESFIKEVKLPGLTNVEKLMACVKNLRKNELVASGQLSKSIARMQSFVDTVIESKGKTGDEFNNFPILYICGAPGSGKTMSTTQICEEAIATRTKNKHEFENAPRLYYLNCPSLKNFSTKKGIEKALKRMDTTQACLKRSPNDVKKAATILILDEVDQLIGNKGTEGILMQLSNWAKDKGNVLSVIGISNSVFNSKSNRLQEYGLVSSSLHGKNYVNKTSSGILTNSIFAIVTPNIIFSPFILSSGCIIE